MILYWYNACADANWTTLAGNWWTDSAHSVQAGALPANGDGVYLTGPTGPNTAPAAALALALFDTSALTQTNWHVSGTTNLSIQAGGTLTIGSSSNPSCLHFWLGTAAATATATFNGNGRNNGTVGNHATFNDTSAMPEAARSATTLPSTTIARPPPTSRSATTRPSTTTATPWARLATTRPSTAAAATAALKALARSATMRPSTTAATTAARSARWAPSSATMRPLPGRASITAPSGATSSSAARRNSPARSATERIRSRPRCPRRRRWKAASASARRKPGLSTR